MTSDASLKGVGFYKSARDVSAAANPEEQPWESKAVACLEQGEVVLISPHWVDDLLNDQVQKICQYSNLTDGVWIWPGDLAYYVRTYHVELPQDFLDHMESRNWAAPELDDADLDAVCERVLQYGAPGVN